VTLGCKRNGEACALRRNPDLVLVVTLLLAGLILALLAVLPR
jgi:hypothetical protein